MSFQQRHATKPGLSRISAANGGCDFPADPAHDYDQAGVLWLGQDDTSSVILAEAPAELASRVDVERFAPIERLLASRSRAARTRLADGNELLVHFIGTPSLPAVAVIPLDMDGFGRLEAVYRLLAMLHGRKIPPDTRLTAQQRSRAKRMLQAFDGARSGATQQDIARVLFRLGRLSRHEWQASAARHAVMSLLRDARAMSTGGYRRLLKHRRHT